MTNRILLALALLAGSAVIHAQSSVSPYTPFGAGAADSGVHGWNAGMAGLGTGIRADNMLNPSNPASLSSLQRKSFKMDIAVSGSGSFFSGRRMHSISGTGNLDRVCLGFRLGGRVAAGVGLVPFSSVEYRIQKSASGEGTGETFNTVYSGSGGLHKAYLSLAVDITDNLSVGVNGSVVMGTVTHTESSEYWTETTESGCNITPYMDFGLQYSKPLGNGGTVTAGLKYGYRQKLSLYNTYTLTDNMDTTSVSDKVLPGTEQYIPETFGAGLSYSTENLTVGVDYRRQEWSSCSTGSDVISYKDMDKLIFGLSYTPDPYAQLLVADKVPLRGLCGQLVPDCRHGSPCQVIHTLLLVGRIFPQRLPDRKQEHRHGKLPEAYGRHLIRGVVVCEKEVRMRRSVRSCRRSFSCSFPR